MARYIDKDEALNAIKYAELGQEYEAVAAIPTADVVEREKGEWQWLASTYDRIPCEKRFWCSECHHETITFDREPWEMFCPSCGADMRKEVE